MNINLLKAEIVAKGLKVKDFLEAVEIERSRYYRILKGEDEFKRGEIQRIGEVLELTEKETYLIFFG